jgi:HEAT repeat protein
MALISVAMTLGMFFYAQSMLHKPRGAAHELRSTSPSRSPNAPRSPAQKDAEQLLQRATANDLAATAQIEARAATWRGRISLTPQLSSLITVGLNANDLRVRTATIQLDLAAMNIGQDAATVDRLAQQANSTDHATRIWAIWTLGLIANRGLQRERVTGLLTAHLADSDIDSRRWAVEALSYVGTDATIPPLLKTMHDDPSPTIRERAACALAQSGMLTNQQRRTAIPTLLTYAEDPSLDAPTHAWTYHALRDITAQNLPDDAGEWRRWYSSSR